MPRSTAEDVGTRLRINRARTPARVVLFFLFLAVAGAKSASTQTVLRFPRVVSGPGVFTGIAVSNPTPSDIALTLTAYNPDGTPRSGPGVTNPQTQWVPAGGQFSRLASQIFGEGEFDGWIRATSASSGLTGFFLTGNTEGTDLDGAQAAAPAAEQIFPMVRTIAPASTELTVVNPHETPSSVELTLYAADGEVRGVRNLSLAPRALLRQRAALLFAGTDAGDASHIRMRAALPVIGFQTVADYLTGGNARETVATVGRTPTPGPRFIVPHVASGGGWLSVLGIVNAAGVAQDVTITAYRDDGRLWDLAGNPKTVRLEGNASLESTVGDVFELDPARLETGWLEVEGSLGFLIPYAGYGVVGARSFALVAGQDSSSASLHQTYAQVAEGVGFFTGLTVVNPGSDSAQVELVVMRADGTTVGQTQVTLPGGTKSARLLRQFIEASLDQVGGWVFLRSSAPVIGAALFGSQSGRALAQVPQLDASGDFLPPAQVSAAITGRVREGGLGVAEVSIALSGPVTATTRTDSNGDYIFPRLPPGEYRVTPSRPGAMVRPIERTVQLGQQNVEGVHFEAGPLGAAESPTVSLITPASTFAGGAGISLRIFGTGFSPVSRVDVDGHPVATTFIGPGELAAAVGSGDLARIGARELVVVTPPPGGGRSDPTVFLVNDEPSNPLIVGRVQVGAFPAGVAIDADRFRALVTNESSDSVSMVDLDQLRIEGSIPVGRSPAEGIAIDAGRDRAVVANVGSDSISVIDLETNQEIGAAGVGRFPTGVAIDPGQGRVLATNSEEDSVSVIDLDTLSAGRIVQVGSRPSGIAVDTLRRRAVVANRGDDTVTVLDLDTLAPVATIPVGSFPRGVAINVATGIAVVTNANSGSVSIIDLNVPGRTPTTIAVGTGPTGVAIHEATNTAVVTNSGIRSGSSNFGNAASVSIINLERLAMVETIGVGAAAFGVAIDQDRQVAVVANFGSNDVTILRVPNPAPEVTGFEPQTFPAGGGAFRLTVRGTGFLRTSVVILNGEALGTTYVSSTELHAEVTVEIQRQVVAVNSISSDQGRQPGETHVQVPITVAVSNPPPGGGTSPLTGETGSNEIEIENPVPILETIDPVQVAANKGAFVLTLGGNNFNASTDVQVGGDTFVPDAVEPTSITLSLTADRLDTGGVPVSVFNPAPGGGRSVILQLKVVRSAPPAPEVNDLTPTSVPVGSPDLVLGIRGTGFQPGSTRVLVGGPGTSLAPTELTLVNESATAIDALLPAEFLTSPGSLEGLVDTPGGGTAAFSFIVAGPTPQPDGIIPESAPLGTPSLTLEVSGSNFVPGAAIEVAGTPLVTIFANAGLLRTTVPGSFFLAPASMEVAVKNPGALPAVAGFLEVLAPGPVIDTLNPSQIPAGQAISITVTGAHLGNATATIDGAPVAVVSQTGVQIVVSVPPLPVGLHTLTLTGPGGSDNRQFEAVEPSTPVLPPVISSFSPPQVSAGIAELLTLAGAGFSNLLGASVDGTAVAIVSPTGAQALVQIPPLGAGLHTLTITGPGGSDSIQFEAVASSLAPTLASISPTSGNQGDIVEVTFYGTNLDQPNLMPLFGGPVSVSSVEVVSSTEVKAVVELTTVGSHRVSVTTDGGSSGFLDFTVHPNDLGLAIALASSTRFGAPGMPGSTDAVGTATRFDGPAGIAFDTNGRLLVGDTGNETVRELDLATDQVNTLAGRPGITGSADGVGSAARFNRPIGTWSDGRYVFVADSGNHTIRSIDRTTGAVSTVAGSAANPGFTDAVGNAARFDAPHSIWGNLRYLYVADTGNNAVRRIDRGSGQVTTLAGSVTGVPGTADGIGTSARFHGPRGIFGNAANLWIADGTSRTLRRIDLLGNNDVSTVAGVPGAGTALDGPARVGTFMNPTGVWSDGTSVYVADGHRIRRVNAAGDLTTLAGSATAGRIDGIGIGASFTNAGNLTGNSKSIWVADTGNHSIRQLVPVFAGVLWVGGAPGAEDRWDAPSNWNPSGVPQATSDVIIPPGRAHYPVLRGNVQLRNLTVADGATLDTGMHTITASGSVLSGNASISGSGLVVMTGTDESIRGNVPNLTITAAVSVAASTTVSGDLLISGAGADLRLNGQTVVVGGALTTQGGGTLTMTHQPDTLKVSGPITFGGGNTNGRLTAGRIVAEGDFTNTASTTDSFRATLDHEVVFQGTSRQTIRMSSASSSQSRFERVVLDNPAGVIFANTIYAHGPVTVSSGSAIGPGPATLDWGLIDSAGDRWQVDETIFDGVASVLPSSLTGNVTFARRAQPPTGGLTVNGNVTVTGVLEMPGRSMTVAGSFRTLGDGGILDMANPSVLTVGGEIRFEGGSTNGRLRGGVIYAQADFTATGAGRFAASNLHRVVFNGVKAQSISVADGSHFQDLQFDNAAGVTLLSNVVATGQLHSGQSVSAIGIGPGSDARVIGKGHALDVAGLNVNGITLDNVALTSTNGILSAFDNVGFTGYSQASTRLTLLHPGGTQPFSMGNIDFGVPPDPEPTTGHYVSVGDTAPGDPNILSLTFNGTFTNALNHTTHYRLDGGAVIHWDAP